jgi:hypothetical protein
MVKHVIIWDFKDELTAEQKKAAALRMKTGLEALVGVVEGLKSLHVATDLLGSSNGDIMLDSEFEDEKALAYYADHPAHVKVKEYVRTVVKSRKCADYKI